MELTPLALILLGLLLAAWTFAAAALIYVSQGRVRQARGARLAARRLARMIDRSPAIPLLVRGDGALEGPERLAAWLGLETMPAFLSELRSSTGGLAEDDLEHLRQEVRRTLKTAAPFSFSLTPRGSRRRLAVHGHQADRQIAAEGAALVWWFDHSQNDADLAEAHREIDELRAERAIMRDLIEALPMPVWVRGPDLALSLVNRAYTEAVGAPQDGSVLREQVELVETVEPRSPADVAAEARASGQAVERAVQVTLAGQRRAMLVRDVPLEGGSVAGIALDMEDQEQAARELREQAEARRALLEQMPTGVALFGSDDTLDYANAAFASLFELDTRQATGEPLKLQALLDDARAAGRLPRPAGPPVSPAELADPQEQPAHGRVLADTAELRLVALPLPDGTLALLAQDRIVPDAPADTRTEAAADEPAKAADLVPLAKTRVALVALVTALVRRREAAIEARDLAFNLRPSRATGTIMADEARLGEALGILVDVAIAAAPEGTEVTMNIARVRGEVRLEIIGEEAGGPARREEHIAQACRIIQAHGGRASVEAGRTTITLP